MPTGFIQVQYDVTAVNIYCVIRDASGAAYRADTQVFEAYVTANLTSTKYAIAMTEQGTASRYYTVAFPSAIGAGIYAVAVFKRVGGSPAESDVVVSGGSIDWDGANIVPLYTRLAPTTVGRTLDVTTTGEAGIDWANIGAPTTTVSLSGTSTKSLQPTVAGRTLDVATTGEAGLDFDNIHDASGAHTLTNIRVPNVTLTDTTTNLTNFDKVGYSLSSAGIQAIWDALTSALTTAGSVGKRIVDFVTTLVYSAPPDPAHYTNARGDKLDNLDAAITSRMATFTLPLNFSALSITSGGFVTITSNIKKNQSLAGFTFVMVDSIDHVSGKPGLTVSAQRSLDGGAFAACANSVTEISAGAYKIDLAASDLNGNDVLLKFSSTGADTRFIAIVTTP
jgi:hypothetical protein